MGLLFLNKLWTEISSTNVAIEAMHDPSQHQWQQAEDDNICCMICPFSKDLHTGIEESKQQSNHLKSGADRREPSVTEKVDMLAQQYQSESQVKLLVDQKSDSAKEPQEYCDLCYDEVKETEFYSLSCKHKFCKYC